MTSLELAYTYAVIAVFAFLFNALRVTSRRVPFCLGDFMLPVLWPLMLIVIFAVYQRTVKIEARRVAARQQVKRSERNVRGTKNNLGG